MKISRIPLSETQRKARRSGSTLVEFAFVVPILLALTMGLIQYGLISNATSTLINLTREGARYAAVHGTETNTTFNGNSEPTDDAIRDYIQQAAASTSIQAADLPDPAITITPAAGASTRISGNSITVTVNYDMRKKFFIPAGFPGLKAFGSNYATTCTMIIE